MTSMTDEMGLYTWILGGVRTSCSSRERLLAFYFRTIEIPDTRIHSSRGSSGKTPKLLTFVREKISPPISEQVHQNSSVSADTPVSPAARRLRTSSDI